MTLHKQKHLLRTNMRKISFLVIFLFSMQIKFAFAVEISINEARNYAVNFASQFTGNHYTVNNISSVFEYKQAGQLAFYIINLKQNQGIIFISSIAESYPVLGFVPNQSYSGTDFHPTAFDNLLTDYAKQILYIKQKNLKATREIKERWHDLKSDISAKGPTGNMGPLVTSIWSQGCFFNDSTPSDQGGPCGHAVTGCVATAMGQVINYYNFPPHGSGIHSYQSNYGKLTANFGITNYAWSLMADTLNGSSSSASVAAVSQLLSHCGISVDMMYSGGSSGAYSEDALKAFTHYFNFSPDIQLLYRDNYSDSVWEQMVTEELDSLRPLYYDGSGTGGHAFVCDGYQNTHYFHFNWGWNGSYNGYFLLTNLNPGGMNFGNYNSAVFGLKPQLPSSCQSQTTILTNSSGNLNDGSSFQNYGDNSSCSWLIQPQGAVALNLDFYTFNLASGDTVFVFDGPNPVSPLLIALTGDSLVKNISSTTGQMFVLFTSDSTSNSEGWSASYRSDFCHGISVMTAPSGTLSDGSGPFLYNNNTYCSWHINPGSSDPILLTFDNFKTESGFDFVYVYNGPNSNATLLGTFDGNTIPQSVTANSGEMYIEFISDGGVVDEGWSAHYVVCIPAANPVANAGTSFCHGDSISLETNLMADSLAWISNGQLISKDSILWVTSSGQFRYVVFRAGCGADSSQTIYITDNALPKPALGNDTLICYESVITMPNMIPFDISNFNYSNYMWNTSDTTQQVDLYNLVEPFIDSTYQFSITVVDSNGCIGSDSILIQIKFCTEGFSENNNNILNIFPNPTNGIINWQSDYYAIGELRIYSTEGKLIEKRQINLHKGIIDVSWLKSDIYLLQILVENLLFNQKLIKL